MSYAQQLGIPEALVGLFDHGVCLIEHVESAVWLTGIAVRLGQQAEKVRLEELRAEGSKSGEVRRHLPDSFGDVSLSGQNPPAHHVSIVSVIVLHLIVVGQARTTLAEQQEQTVTEMAR